MIINLFFFFFFLFLPYFQLHSAAYHAGAVLPPLPMIPARLSNHPGSYQTNMVGGQQFIRLVWDVILHHSTTHPPPRATRTRLTHFWRNPLPGTRRRAIHPAAAAAGTKYVLEYLYCVLLLPVRYDTYNKWDISSSCQRESMSHGTGNIT